MLIKKGISIAVLMMLICSCVRNHRTMDMERITNRDLDVLIAGKDRTYEDIIRVLHLDPSDDFMFPGSSMEEFVSYRFLVGTRALFLKVSRSNIVSQAFFAEDLNPLEVERVEHMTNADLDRLITGKNRKFNEVFQELYLAHSKGSMTPGGSVELITYAFAVGNRHLFLDVLNGSNIVARAYFADDSIRRIPATESRNTNIVRKPQ